jgi:ferredoxin
VITDGVPNLLIECMQTHRVDEAKADDLHASGIGWMEFNARDVIKDALHLHPIHGSFVRVGGRHCAECIARLKQEQQALQDHLRREQAKKQARLEALGAMKSKTHFGFPRSSRPVPTTTLRRSQDRPWYCTSCKMKVWESYRSVCPNCKASRTTTAQAVTTRDAASMSPELSARTLALDLDLQDAPEYHRGSHANDHQRGGGTDRG